MTVRLSRGCGWACFAIVVALTLAATAANTKSRPPAGKPKTPSSPKPKAPSSGTDPESATYVGGSSGDARGAADRDAMIQSIEQQLATMPALGPTQKPTAPSKDDFFALATVQAEDPVTANLALVHGLHEVAEKAADFLLAAHDGEQRLWRVLARGKNETAPRRVIAESQNLEKKLHAFSLKKIGEKKSAQDAFVVGTAELNLATKHADVCFRVMRGARNIADFVVSYIHAAPKRTERQWHVFFRATADDEAQRYVQDLRKMYDSVEQQRAEMATIYHAKTTRRC